MPLSLVMTVAPGDRVIGHARILAVLGKPDSALIETGKRQIVRQVLKYCRHECKYWPVRSAECYFPCCYVHCVHAR